MIKKIWIESQEMYEHHGKGEVDIMLGGYDSWQEWLQMENEDTVKSVLKDVLEQLDSKNE